MSTAVVRVPYKLHSHPQATHSSKPMQQHCCVTQDYKFLTFARIPPPPPPPWVDAHGLLQHAVQGYVQKQTPKLTHAQRNTLDAALADLSLEWYIDLLSRLHINTFRYV